MNLCIALEHLSHVSSLEGNISESGQYLQDMIKILTENNNKLNNFINKMFNSYKFTFKLILHLIIYQV